MALVSTYLARTAHLDQRPRAASVARGLVERIAAFVRISAEAWAEARALEQEMRRKYPHIDS